MYVIGIKADGVDLVAKNNLHDDMEANEVVYKYTSKRLSAGGAPNNWDWAMMRVGWHPDYGKILMIWNWPYYSRSYESPVKPIGLFW